MRLVWTDAAVRDLSAARHYIAVDDPGAARQQIERILNAVMGLAQFPDRGRPGRRAGTRELVMVRTPFIVAYRVRGDAIDILRVLHGRRRWTDRFEPA
jgi:toxin ParE1/3/4